MLTHLGHTVFAAATWRAMRGLPYWVAALFAIAIGAAMLYRGRRRW